MMAPVREQNEQEKAQRLAERQAEQAAKVQHMKDVKQIVKDNAMRQVQDNEAYIMLSFDNFANKAAFCERFGYDPMTSSSRVKYLTTRWRLCLNNVNGRGYSDIWTEQR